MYEQRLQAGALRVVDRHIAVAVHQQQRRAGALLIEQVDEWLTCRRYLSEESMRLLGHARTDAIESISQTINEEVDTLPAAA